MHQSGLSEISSRGYSGSRRPYRDDAPLGFGVLIGTLGAYPLIVSALICLAASTASAVIARALRTMVVNFSQMQPDTVQLHALVVKLARPRAVLGFKQIFALGRTLLV
jgi:hypothetical protein